MIVHVLIVTVLHIFLYGHSTRLYLCIVIPYTTNFSRLYSPVYEKWCDRYQFIHEKWTRLGTKNYINKNDKNILRQITHISYMTATVIIDLYFIANVNELCNKYDIVKNPIIVR